MEGPAQWSAGWTKAVADIGFRKMVELLVGSGVFYHLYNQVSYQALTEISPVTFSVGNALKRIAVIVASVGTNTQSSPLHLSLFEFSDFE